MLKKIVVGILTVSLFITLLGCSQGKITKPDPTDTPQTNGDDSTMDQGNDTSKGAGTDQDTDGKVEDNAGDDVKAEDSNANNGSENTPDTNAKEGQNVEENADSSQPDSKEAKEDPEVLTDSGTYVGQIDGNSIEIKISGVPEAKSARAFMISEDYKNEFNELGLKEGEQVRFKFIQKENGQNVITKIERITSS